MKKRKQKVRKVIIIASVMILFLIGYHYYRTQKNNYNLIKINRSEYLVYTEKETQYGNYNQYKPFLNIKGETGTLINQDITSYLSNFEKENICVTYDYDINGKVLSLILKVEDYSYVESAAVLYFRSYHVRLDTLDILSNEDILEFFDMNQESFNSILNQKIEEYYYGLVNQNLINANQCDFSCFLEARDFTNGIEDVELFVKDGKLVAFKPYIFMVEDAEEVHYSFEIE